MTVDTAYCNFQSKARTATLLALPTVLLVVLPLLATTIALPLLGTSMKHIRKVFQLSGAVIALDTPLILLSYSASRSRDQSFASYVNALHLQLEKAPIDEFKILINKDFVKPYLSTMPCLLEVFSKDKVKKKVLEEKFAKFKQS